MASPGGDRILRNSRPDVLLIVLDTLRRDRLSIYGNPRETSPHLDAFAAGATVFDRAVSSSQWTVPAHASLFTGLYPSVHRVTQGHSRLSERIFTLAQRLSEAGYHTVSFCNNALVGLLDNGLQRGFERFYNYAGAAPNRPFDSRGPAARVAGRQFSRFARWVENRFARSDTLFRIAQHPRLTPLWSRLIRFKGCTEASIDDLVAYWRRHMSGGSGRPLFAFLNLMGTHLPYTPPREVIDRVAPEIYGDRRAHAFMRFINTNAAGWSCPPDPPYEEWQRAVLRGFHDAEIASQDAHLGRLFRHLEAMAALDRALIIVVADHGEMHGGHGLFGHGFSAYQELVHVPLIIRGEGFPAGVRIGISVSTRRVFHTVLQAAGIDASPAAGGGAELALANAVDGLSDPEGGVVFAEAFPSQMVLSLLRRRNPSLIERRRLDQVCRAVYVDGHKLMTVGPHVEGLYEVERDPAEVHDVADVHPGIVTGLKHRLDTWLDAAGLLRHDRAEYSEVSPEAMRQLRALGYID